MGKNILSQTEIDSLISAISSGDVEPETQPEESASLKPGANVYDFRRPTKFSKEQLRTLKVIHENYARILANFLTAYMRVPVKMECVSVSQVTYEEFISSISIPTVVTVFNMAPELGVAVMEINPDSALILIDLNFGGNGKVVPRTKELTEIELEVMRTVNAKIIDNLTHVWKGIAPISPQIEGIDTNPHFNQVIASTETVAQVVLSIQIYDNRNMMHLCFPYITLEKVISNLTAQHWFNEYQKTSSRPAPENFTDQLEKASVQVQARLGSTIITMDDFIHMQEGDVLQLNRKEGEPLDLYVEGQPIFKGHPGVGEGNNLSIKISGLAEKGE